MFIFIHIRSKRKDIVGLRLSHQEKQSNTQHDDSTKKEKRISASWEAVPDTDEKIIINDRIFIHLFI